MSAKTPSSPGTRSKSDPTSRAHGGREAAYYGNTYRLENSTVTIEEGLSGPLAKIVTQRGIEYAGPLPTETIEAIEEVGDRV